MSLGIGGYFGIGVESNNVTTATSAVDFVPILTENISITEAPFFLQELDGLFDESSVVPGPLSIAGQVTTEGFPRAMGYFLRMALDATSTSVGTAATATEWYNLADSNAALRVHQFIGKQTEFQSGSGSTLPTMTFEIARGTSGSGVASAFVYNNMTVSGLELSLEAGGLMRLSADCVGIGYGGRRARSTPSYNADVPFSWRNTSVSISGAGAANLQSFTLRINNALEAYRFIDASSARLPSQIRRTGNRSFELSGTMYFNRDQEYDDFLAGNLKNISITCIDPSSARLRINLPSYRYSAVAPNLSGPGPIFIQFAGRGLYNTGSATACEIIVANGRISDYRTNSLG